MEFEQDSTNERLHGVILPPRSPVGKTQAEFLPPKGLLWSPKEQYRLFSNPEGLGTSRWIMGLATIDPHSHKVQVQTRLYKIPKFGANRPKSKQDTAIWKFQNYKEMYGHPDAVMPCISLLILTFLNRCISVKTSLINTKLEDFVNLGVLFLTMWINSC